MSKRLGAFLLIEPRVGPWSPEHELRALHAHLRGSRPIRLGALRQGARFNDIVARREANARG